ncbi:MAG TPA: hypothetical protein GX406_07770 [Pseudoclavibacter sp.]|nr:hypothetical protein [Pseudoclavibacter sp.]
MGRPRRRAHRVEVPFDAERARTGWRRVELRAGFRWNVQPMSASRAVKTYICPGCGNEIAPGVEHLVVWRADGVLGDASDLASRRHWHEACWRVGP